MVVLSGTLDVCVVEAEGLPNLDQSKRHPENLTDAYVKVSLVPAGKKGKLRKIGETQVVKDSLYPKWCSEFSTQLQCEDIQGVRFDVVDDDKFKDDKVGYAIASLEGIERGTEVSLLLDLTNSKKTWTGKLKVRVKLS